MPFTVRFNYSCSAYSIGQQRPDHYDTIQVSVFISDSSAGAVLVSLLDTFSIFLESI